MKLKLVSLQPKYDFGNILESKEGLFGRVTSVSATVQWKDKTPQHVIQYSVRSGSDGCDWFTIEEQDVKRMVSES